MTTTTVPSVHDVTRIVTIESPVLRNLAITDCYSRLAAAFAERVGEDANWCTDATCASKQAGQSIRGEDSGCLLARSVGVLPLAAVWVVSASATGGPEQSPVRAVQKSGRATSASISVREQIRATVNGRHAADHAALVHQVRGTALSAVYATGNSTAAVRKAVMHAAGGNTARLRKNIAAGEIR